MADFDLHIVTQVRTVFEGRVHSIVVPAAEGYLGVMAHHAPLLATLGRGTLNVKSAGGEKDYQVTGGFLEVNNNVATLLVDELGEEG